LEALPSKTSVGALWISRIGDDGLVGSNMTFLVTPIGTDGASGSIICGPGGGPNDSIAPLPVMTT
jgi:hypothetical protein